MHVQCKEIPALFVFLQQAPSNVLYMYDIYMIILLHNKQHKLVKLFVTFFKSGEYFCHWTVSRDNCNVHILKDTHTRTNCLQHWDPNTRQKLCIWGSNTSCGSIRVSPEMNSFPCKVGVKTPGIRHAMNSTQRIPWIVLKNQCSAKMLFVKSFKIDLWCRPQKSSASWNLCFGGHFFRSDYLNSQVAARLVPWNVPVSCSASLRKQTNFLPVALRR